jgi:hypothetical protein
MDTFYSGVPWAERISLCLVYWPTFMSCLLHSCNVWDVRTCERVRACEFGREVVPTLGVGGGRRAFSQLICVRVHASASAFVRRWWVGTCAGGVVGGRGSQDRYVERIEDAYKKFVHAGVTDLFVVQAHPNPRISSDKLTSAFLPDSHP